MNKDIEGRNLIEGLDINWDKSNKSLEIKGVPQKPHEINIYRYWYYLFGNKYNQVFHSMVKGKLDLIHKCINLHIDNNIDIVDLKIIGPVWTTFIISNLTIENILKYYKYYEFKTYGIDQYPLRSQDIYSLYCDLSEYGQEVITRKSSDLNEKYDINKEFNVVQYIYKYSCASDISCIESMKIVMKELVYIIESLITSFEDDVTGCKDHVIFDMFS